MTTTTYPIIYKMIPTQYAFYISEDGTVQIQPITKLPKEMKFATEEEAREYVERYDEQL